MENDDVVTTPQAAPVTPPPSGQSANPPANAASTQMSATDREAIQQRAIADERARAMAIRTAAQPFMASQRLTGEQLEELVALGLSTDATSTRMLAMIADAPSAACIGWKAQLQISVAWACAAWLWRLATSVAITPPKWCVLACVRPP